MTYSPKTWVNGETIYAASLNNIEQGISDNDTAIASLQPAVSDLEDATYTYIPNKNKFPSDATWYPATMNASGQLVEKLDSNATEEDYIPVTAGEDWTISWKAKDLNCTMYIYAYEADHTYIGQLSSATMNAVTRYKTITTPANCAYLRLRVYRNLATYTDIIPEELQVEKGSTATAYEPQQDVPTPKVNILSDEVDLVEAALIPTKTVISDVNLLENLEYGYINNEGTFVTSTTGWNRSGYIPVKPGQFVYFYNINNFNYFAYFNASKTYLGGKDLETPYVTDSSMLCVHQVPANAYYMMVSLEDSKASTCWGNYTPTVPTGALIKAAEARSYEYFPENPCDYEGMDICTFRKGLCIGDSITAGGFNYTTGTNPWTDGNVYSYPAQLQKMTGITIDNKGDSGCTTEDWWDIYGTGGTNPMDFSGYDFAIIHLGINDVSNSVPTADTEAAYQNIIDALKTANTGIKIFVCTIIPGYADAIIGDTTYGTINNLIKSFASQENVYLCDLTTYGHEYKQSAYTAGHLTAYGYWRLAKDLMSYIGYIMQNNAPEFRFIQFIGTDMTY